MRLLRIVGPVACVVFSATCSDARSNLLTAVDPDLIRPEDVNSPEGAEAVRTGALSHFRAATGGGPWGNYWGNGGELADEWENSAGGDREPDRRSIVAAGDGPYRATSMVRTMANLAISGLRRYTPRPEYNIAEMYFIRGFAEMQMAESVCNGVVFSDGAADPPVPGFPETDSAAFVRAVASFDSALALSGEADPGATLVRNATTIARARALANLNRQAEAAATIAAAGIGTTFTYDLTFSIATGDNGLWNYAVSQRRASVADSLSGRGRDIIVAGQLPFFSAKDPRVPASYIVQNGGRDTVKGVDGSTLVRTTTLWSRTTPIAVVNGIDARLIEAEARAKAGDAPGTMAILNALRAGPPKLGEVQVAAGQLPPLAAPPGTADLVTLFFREKAFWTFGRGQRLGDLRRLMRQYGRSEETTFPTGAYFNGGTYGHAVNFTVPLSERVNPNFVDCFDRKP